MKYPYRVEELKPLTFVDILHGQALNHPHKRAFTFLLDGEIESVSLTYQELDKQAREIASLLQLYLKVGDRALLLYPPGLEFIAAFFGCLYAGVIAVPAYPPKRNQNLSRLKAIVSDSQASVALTTKAQLSDIEAKLGEDPQIAAIRCIATDHRVHGEDFSPYCATPETLAFLQYTSGSTGKPKGVMVSHGNLICNSKYMELIWEYTSDSVMVTWLPTFHDMGLIYGMLQPIYKGFPCYMMAPVSFMQRPIRWLQAISRYQATHSGAPNFAYELCLRKISPEQRTTLDLSR